MNLTLFFVNTNAALFGDVFFKVAGERGDHLDAVLGEEGGNPVEAGAGRRVDVLDDRGVAPIDHVAVQGAGAGHHRAEAGVHRRAAAGDVHGADHRVAEDPIDDVSRGVGIHVVLTSRPRW